MNRLHIVYWLVHTQGIQWTAYRLRHSLSHRWGLPRWRMPVTTWERQPLSSHLLSGVPADPNGYCTFRRQSAPTFFFSPQNRAPYAPLFTAMDTEEKENPISEAEAIGEGFFCLFHHAKHRLGFPPDWHCNPFTEQRANSEVHWSRITDTYPLVRAYWRTGKEEYAERFWRLVENWREKNLPNQGANWKCGQETSLRVLAWCFGLYAFAEATATTPVRVAGLVQMLAFSGERIEKTLDYALSQRNNHGISEGAGLWTLGILFPEFRHAERWEAKGRKILEALGRDLIAEDGSFVQNSMNYHRLMLHLFLWVLRLGDLHLKPFRPELKERVKRAGEFLLMLMEESTGQVPLYGPNDGAWIFPLAGGGSEDYRPVAQAVHFYTHGEKRFGPGPWDEETLWWFGPSALKAPRATEVKRKESAMRNRDVAWLSRQNVMNWN